MKKSILSFVIATAIAPIAQNAVAQAPQTAPASVTEAQRSVQIAASNYHAALDTFNRAPASERDYAAQKLDSATNNYQTAVLKEKVAIKQWLTPPSEDRAPAPAPHVQHFSEPQNVAIPTLIAPQAAPVAAPVSSGYREPQNIAVPTVIAPQAAPEAKPVSTGYREPQNIAVPTVIAPQAAPEAKPVSTGYREPQNVVIPDAPKPYATPSRLAATDVSKTPTLIAPPVAPVAKPVSTGYREPQNVAVPTVIAPQAAPQAKPVSTGYREPQNVVIPDAPKPYAAPSLLAAAAAPTKTPELIAPPVAPVAKPVSTGYREPQNVAVPTVIAPQAAPTATPVSTGYREPQNVAVPTVIAPQAAPTLQRTPAQTVPATPEARRPVTLAAYQAPVGKEIAGTGYKGEVTSRAANLSSRSTLTAPTSTTTGAVILPGNRGRSNLMSDPAFQAVLTDLNSLNNDKLEKTGDIAGTTGINQETAQAIYKKLDQSQYVTDHAQDKLDAQATSKKADANTLAIDAEKARATLAESDNASLIAKNAGKIATNAQTSAANTSSINKLTATTTLLQTKTTKDIAAETFRAEVAETNNKNAITSESQRAKIAEQLNSDATTVNKAQIQSETIRATKAEQANATAIATNATAIDTETKRATAEEKRLDAVKVEKSEFKTLQSEVKQKVDNSTFQQRAADVDARIAQHKADQDKVNKAVAGKLDNHEDRIQTLEANKGYGNKFDALKKSVERNRKIAGAGASAAMAQANIPQVLDSQSFAVGAAVGGYDSQNALAVGFSARVSKNVTVKSSVSTDTANNFGYGAGVSIGW